MADVSWPEYWAESVRCGWWPDALSLSSGAAAHHQLLPVVATGGHLDSLGLRLQEEPYNV